MKKTPKIYIFSYYFPPLGRATGVLMRYFVENLADLGWEARVMTTGSFASVLFGGQKDSSLSGVFDKNDKVRIVRVKNTIGANLGPFLSVLRIWSSQFLGWRKKSLERLSEMYDGPGIVYASVPPEDNAILAYEFSRRYKLPLVIDFKDDYFKIPPEIIKAADLILVSNPVSLEHMAEYYGFSRAKARVFYNGNSKPVDSSLQKLAKSDNKFRVAFTGTLCPTTRPEFLAKTMKYAAKTRPELAEKLDISIYGPRSYYYYLHLLPHLSEKARYLGFVPSFSDLLRQLAENMDVGVASFNEDWKYGLSSKTFTYMAAGLPILAYGPKDGALQRFIEENQIGLFSEIGDMDALLNNLQRMSSEPALMKKFRTNIRKKAPLFTMQAQVKNIEKDLRKLL